MRNELLLVAALIAAPTLIAQEKKAPPAADAAAQQPNPKAPEHDALKSFVGDWETTCKIAAGAMGNDKPLESKGTEHCELVCNGLYMKGSINATLEGKPFQGCWIAGYDPFQKHYTSIWVSNQDEPVSTGTGTYDSKTRTWTFLCTSTEGPVRSTMVFKDNDNSVETSFTKGADGKEKQCMEITRKRAGKATPMPVDASAKAPSKELESLYDGIGTWNAIVKIGPTPGVPGMEKGSESKATEKCVPICGGKWIWTDFNGDMGGPFEGHAITGYDATEKKYVSFWIDSGGAVAMKTTGNWDAKTKACTMNGSCVDESGKPMTVNQVSTQTDANTRDLHMTFKGATGTMVMDINYKKSPTKG